MGFWNGLTKVVQGKPVFEVTDEQVEQSKDTSAAVNHQDTASTRTIPELSLENCESNINGQEMMVTSWVTNESSEEIELDKIVMLGEKTELDKIFSPGKAQEIVLYRGKVPTNDSYDTANLYYKRRSDGNYFRADFRLEFDYDSEGFYRVEEFHPIRPVRDV